MINHNPDLMRLFTDGYEVEVIDDGYLLIHNVPYVTPEAVIKRGILVSNLYHDGGKTKKPEWHVAFFIGECPSNSKGTPLNMVINHEEKDFGHGYKSTNTMSAKADYKDHHEKMVRYINIISAEAKELDDSVTAATFRVIEPREENSVFEYADTNSTRALIHPITNKVSGQKIAVIGVGGTGSYLLDFLAKTPVAEIHLYDGDYFFQNNAFRAPGATPKDKFQERLKKTDYYKGIYSNMHKHVYSHPYNIDETNLNELADKTFVFIAMDTCPEKKAIIEYLEAQGISFIHTGIGLEDVGNALRGQVKVTTSLPDKRRHVDNRVTYHNPDEDIYEQNIQIAELNALCAVLAIIKWKKLSGIYKEHANELFNCYLLYTNEIINDDI